MKQAATTINKNFPIFFLEGNRYLCIDLTQFENEELIADLLDIADVQACKDEETISLEEFNQYIDERLKLNVQGCH